MNETLSPVPIWTVAVHSDLLPYYLMVVGLAVTFARFLFFRRKPRLPPGPRGLPLLGNVFQLPQFQWLRFTEWKKQYGPIFSLNLAGQPVVVLNTLKVTNDLLDRRSAIYSDRPRFIMAGEILTGGLFLAFTHYGDLWRKLRKAAHEGMNPRRVEAYRPLQEVEAARLVENLINDPDSWNDHLKCSAASIVKGAIYGAQPITSKNDPLVTHINNCLHRLVTASLPGAFLVDIFPVMRFLPAWIARWKREGLQHFEKDSRLFQGFMDDVRNQIAQGSHKPSFTSTLIENSEKHDLSKKQESWLAGALFGAGSETTAATLGVFILAMRLHPNVMKRAQAEIDSVVGRGRMPTFSDRPYLPYIRAMVKEVLRWRPVGPLGLPRRSIKDDVYNGYFIPKGTLVLANVWAMNRDPDLFPDFEEFQPERFLDESGTIDIAPDETHQQGHATYGFGRRICPGMHLANQALFIDIASILWATSIEPACDEYGQIITPSRDACLDEGLVVRPVPFKCKIVPRCSDVREMLALAKEKQT